MTTPLVIVESPTKAKTLSRFLGKDFQIEASIGHIRDLPEGAKEIPAAYKGEPWARLGVKVDDHFEPIYVIPAAKKKQVKKLKDMLKEANELYLATDEDREGEAISWHLLEILKPKIPVKRLVFHEITKEAILDALEHPRDLDDDLVRAQEARRIVDRLYGYEVSPLLWRKIRPRLSAGRVQSVAVRLIVERERQRMRFIEAQWWDLLGKFAKQSEYSTFTAPLVAVGERKLPTSRDFDPDTGLLKHPKLLRMNESDVLTLAEQLRQGNCRVLERDEKPYTLYPSPPFTTSTLQQEANRKFGFTARQTMQVAQNLYENGYITYMRTDSTNLSHEAISAARNLVQSEYGLEYLPNSPRIYRTKVKNAQEAHEAIRPSGNHFARPETLRMKLTPDAFRLYDLIWKRTVASQMENARGRRATVVVGLGEGERMGRFETSGSRIEFPGFLRAYVEGSDDPLGQIADRDTWLPPMEVGETLRCEGLDPKSHTTAPPNRFSEAALTKTLEDKGIGRPSTYASIIETILARQYVVKKNGALVPTWVAFAVLQLLEIHLPSLIDYDFTAKMEDELDEISRGERNYLDYLNGFYFGDDDTDGTNADHFQSCSDSDSRSGSNAPVDSAKTSVDSAKTHTAVGLKLQLETKVGEIDARDVNRILLGTPIVDGVAVEPIYVRVGRYGPYLEQGELRANFPETMAPDELTLAKAVELLQQAQQVEEPLGICPDTGRAIYVKIGRFGPYVQREAEKEGDKPQYASLLKGMDPGQVTLEEAVELLRLPKTLGTHPESGDPVITSNGRFGPYVKCGTETRSLTAGLSPIRVTLEEALILLAQPKQSSRRGAVGGTTKTREPIKTFEHPSPVTEKPVKLLSGRFGPYVTDGVTNASLPRDLEPKDLTFEQAISLLEQRAIRDAEKGPSKRRTTKKAVKKIAKKVAKQAVKKATKKAVKKTAKKAVKKTTEEVVAKDVADPVDMANASESVD